MRNVACRTIARRNGASARDHADRGRDVDRQLLAGVPKFAGLRMGRGGSG